MMKSLDSCIISGLVDYGLWPKPGHHLLLSIKFYWNTDPPVNFDIVLSVFTIQWQS